MRAIITLLIITLIAQLGGVWVIYSTALMLHKNNKAARIADKSKWVSFTLTAEALQAKLIEDDELIIDNQRFDIIEMQFTLDKIVVTAIADRAENKLQNTLARMQKDSSGWAGVANVICSMSIASYLPSPITEVPPAHIGDNTLCHRSYYRGSASTDVALTIDHPPSVC